MTNNIFQGQSKEAQCVRAWDALLRSGLWIDTEEFARVFDFKHISGERGSASSLLALLPQEFATADLIKLRARKGQSVTPTSINSLLCRWRKLNRIDKTADGKWRRLK